eukprot:scaffold115746_cov25-Prasinocladus_malaysianus.AAC.1
MSIGQQDGPLISVSCQINLSKYTGNWSIRQCIGLCRYTARALSFAFCRATPVTNKDGGRSVIAQPMPI